MFLHQCIISYKDIPTNAVNAIVSIEDKKFFSHRGYDPYAILRAAYAYIRNKGVITQGGSTITQQLARNIFLNFDETWERKAREIFISIELEKKYSKQQIMEFYLNNIYFANGYYGLQAASFGYFGNIGISGLLDAFAFDKLTCQYAVNTVAATSRYVRVQSLPLGKYYAVQTPYKLDLGASYDDVSVESVVGSTYTAPAPATYKVIRKSDDAAWMVSSDMQKGIILLLED